VKLALLTIGDGSTLWPTPTAMDANSSGAAGYSTASGRHSGTTLVDAAVRKALWATPTARDWKDRTCVSANVPTNSLLGRQVLRTPWDGEGISPAGRTLNPRFSERLMGWPPGWTVCDSPATESFRNRQRVLSCI
jgi:hypothetical protein